jgi:outer membrane protein assembly factor BamB
VFDLRGISPDLWRWFVTLVVSFVALFSSDYASYNKNFRDGIDEVKPSGSGLEASWTSPLSKITLNSEAENIASPQVDTSFTGVYPTTVSDWPMAAANSQRTSWTPEEVRGQLRPIWYKPIEPYIPQKVQIIATNGTLYISTARGLYALDAQTGAEKWVYPTELPLGHSPTIHNGVAYVGGFDHKLHAINANTGQGLWTFEAEAGFQTNPLVVNGLIYAGNRDSYMYAIYANEHPQRGTLAWKYKTDGPVLYSAAYKDNTIYFASDDSYAYALNAQTGQLIWKSAKLPGAGFHSWWPVIYRDKVIFSGSPNYRVGVAPGPGDTLDGLDRDDVYPNRATEPRGTYVGPVGREPGDWAVGTKTIDASRIIDYFEDKPWRRTYFVLEQGTGIEYTFDSDGDGKKEYAPILWHGTQNGNRYPPIVGIDDVVYQSSNYQSDLWIPAGSVSGWKIGTQYISIPEGGWYAIDEPMAYSAGGRLIYFNHCCDRVVGAVDIATTHPVQGWLYLNYNIADVIPGYNSQYAPPFIRNDWPGAYGGPNGIYNSHGDQNPPIPYAGKVYVHRSNAVIAFGNYSGQVTGLPVFKTVTPQPAKVSSPNTTQLKQRLAAEIQKMIDAGHLRAGYGDAGNTNDQYGDYLMDYWHNPADTVYTLIRALPHLPEDMQIRTKAYLQDEFAHYPPYTVTHVGFSDGAARETFDLPPEAESARHFFGPVGSANLPPHTFYALLRYAEVFGNAKTIFDNSRDKLPPALSEDDFNNMPDELNSYIVGYWAYLELEKLAGYPQSNDVKTELNRLLDLRVSTFTKDTPYPNPKFPDFHQIYLNSLNVARNFMYLTPELAQYLRDNRLAAVQEAIDEYNRVGPFWFVSKTEQALGENAIQHYYDVNALFQAKALILKEPREELVKYLDVPAFAVGDLFYIQNLIAVIEAPYSLEKTASPSSGDQGVTITYTLSFFGSGDTLILSDTLPSGVSAPVGFELEGTTITPTYQSGQHRLTWSDTPATGQKVTIRYSVVITTSASQSLVNVAQLRGPDDILSTATATVISNPHRTYLPLVLCQC